MQKWIFLPQKDGALSKAYWYQMCCVRDVHRFQTKLSVQGRSEHSSRSASGLARSPGFAFSIVVAVHRSVFLRMMNVVCMPRAPVLVQPQLGIFPFHHWKFSTRHQIQTFFGGEEQLPQVTFLWITWLSLRFIDNCMILVVLVGKKVFVYKKKKRLNIQDKMLFLS